MSPRDADSTVMSRFDEYVQTIRELWAAFNRGDYEGALSRAHPDVEMQDYPDLPDAQWHRGHGGAAAWVVKLQQAFGEFRIEPFEFIPLDEATLLVSVHATGIGRRAGVPADRRVTAVVTMRDGLCARMALYRNKPEALRGAADWLEAVGLRE